MNTSETNIRTDARHAHGPPRHAETDRRGHGRIGRRVAFQPLRTQRHRPCQTNWDKTFPKSQKVDHQKVTFKNRYGITLAGDLYLPKDRGESAAAGACRRRSVRRGEGAVVGALRPDHGGARLRHAGVRSVLHRRKRRRAAQRRLARHQHRGFQRGRRLSRPAPFGGSRADRHHRHLRLGRHGAERRRRRQARQGGRRPAPCTT